MTTSTVGRHAEPSTRIATQSGSDQQWWSHIDDAVDTSQTPAATLDGSGGGEAFSLDFDVEPLPASPPQSIRGGKAPSPVKGRVAVDCIRCCVPPYRQHELEQLVEHYWGERGWETQNHGQWQRSKSKRHPCGIILAYDGDERPDKQYSMVEIPGSCLALYDDLEHKRLVSILVQMCARFTRIDLCYDEVRPEGDSTIIKQMRDAARADQLCLLRKVTLHEGYDQDGLNNWGISFGSRGSNGSGRYMRVYDKGLEQGVMPPHHWVRLEVEYSGDAATEVACTFAEHEDAWMCIYGYVTGCVDFREANGRRELKRRARLSWWDRWCCLPTMRPVLFRPPSDLNKHSAWLARCVIPRLRALTEATDIEIEQYLSWCSADEEHSEKLTSDIVAQQFFKRVPELLESGTPGCLTLTLSERAA